MCHRAIAHNFQKGKSQIDKNRETQSVKKYHVQRLLAYFEVNLEVDLRD